MSDTEPESDEAADEAAPTLNEIVSSALKNIDTVDYEVGDYHIEVFSSFWSGKTLSISYDGDEIFRFRP